MKNPLHMSKTERFIRSLKFIFKPSWWLMSYPYSAEWDGRLLSLLDGHKFEKLDVHTATLFNKTIWIANHTYASFRSYVILWVRPSRLTIEYAMHRLWEDAP